MLAEKEVVRTSTVLPSAYAAPPPIIARFAEKEDWTTSTLGTLFTASAPPSSTAALLSKAVSFTYSWAEAVAMYTPPPSKAELPRTAVRESPQWLLGPQ